MNGINDTTFGEIFCEEFREKDVLRLLMQEDAHQGLETIPRLQKELEQMPAGRITRKIGTGRS